MVYLALSIFFSSLIYVLFSLIGQRKLQLLPCLIINYFFASACAIANFIRVDELFRITWWPAAIGIGVLFISIFIVMAKTTQQLGLATASVASKMSLVVPVIVALLFFNERLYFLKFAGLVLGII
ncbi:MAG: EamA/RhaT family transporter, partial [Luteibaculum sp.]